VYFIGLFLAVGLWLAGGLMRVPEFNVSTDVELAWKGIPGKNANNPVFSILNEQPNVAIRTRNATLDES
jgi:hypothetical protein